MEKKVVKLTEQDLHRIVKESVKKVLKEDERSFPNSVPGDNDVYYPGDINPDVWDALQRGDYGIENIPTYDVFNDKSLSLTELPQILQSPVYDSNNKCVGKLADLHFKYDTETNKFC